MQKRPCQPVEEMTGCANKMIVLQFQRAKEMVLELLAEKDMQGPGGGMGTFNNFDGMGHGGGGPGGMEVRHCS